MSAIKHGLWRVRILSLALALVSCIPMNATVEKSPTPKQAILPKSTLALSPRPITALPSETPAYSVKQINLCQTRAEVSIDKINVGEENGLLLKSGLDLTSLRFVNHRIDKVLEWVNAKSILDVSPDGSQLLYIRLGIDAQIVSFFRNNISGTSETKIAEWPFPASAEWVSDLRIAFFDQYRPISIFSIPANTTTDLSETGSVVPGHGLISPDGNHLLGLEQTSAYQWFIYDFQTDQSVDALNWVGVDSKHATNFLTEIRSFWMPNGISVIIQRAYGIDIASNLSIEEAINKEYVLKSFEMPEVGLRTGIIGLSDNGEFLALSRFSPTQGKSGPNLFYVLNVQNRDLYNYCLNFQAIIGATKFSPDRRFVAWTLWDNETTSSNRKTIVLEIKTGQYASLPNVELIDWVKLTDG